MHKNNISEVAVKSCIFRNVSGLATLYKKLRPVSQNIVWWCCNNNLQSCNLKTSICFKTDPQNFKVLGNDRSFSNLDDSVISYDDLKYYFMVLFTSRQWDDIDAFLGLDTYFLWGWKQLWLIQLSATTVMKLGFFPQLNSLVKLHHLTHPSMCLCRFSRYFWHLKFFLVWLGLHQL